MVPGADTGAAPDEILQFKLGNKNKFIPNSSGANQLGYQLLNQQYGSNSPLNSHVLYSSQERKRSNGKIYPIFPQNGHNQVIDFANQNSQIQYIINQEGAFNDPTHLKYKKNSKGQVVATANNFLPQSSQSQQIQAAFLKQNSSNTFLESDQYNYQIQSVPS